MRYISQDEQFNSFNQWAFKQQQKQGQKYRSFIENQQRYINEMKSLGYGDQISEYFWTVSVQKKRQKGNFSFMTMGISKYDLTRIISPGMPMILCREIMKTWVKPQHQLSVQSKLAKIQKLKKYTKGIVESANENVNAKSFYVMQVIKLVGRIKDQETLAKSVQQLMLKYCLQRLQQ